MRQIYKISVRLIRLSISQEPRSERMSETDRQVHCVRDHEKRSSLLPSSHDTTSGPLKQNGLVSRAALLP